MLIRLSEGKLTPSALVRELKVIFENRTGIPANELILVYNEVILNDGNTFSSYGINVDTPIEVLVPFVPAACA